MKLIKFFIFILILLLYGCATNYHPLGLTGGYSDIQLNKDIYKISFRGNGYSDLNRVQDFLLYRCAELTKNAGYKYFIILSIVDNTNKHIVKTPTTIYSTGSGHYNGQTIPYGFFYGNGSYNTNTIINHGQTDVIEKHTSTAIIKLLKSDKDYPLAINALNVLNSLHI